MTQAAAMPFVQIREFGDDAKLLAGGRIWFYELGSTTPKTVWTDIAMTTPATNPVVLSASGSAKIFCDGAYSYKIERFVSGVYVEQQTGDFTTAAGSGDTGLTIFQDYDALEASDGSALVAAVIDGFNAGDKAGGIFFRDNSQTAITTDGVVVVGPTFKYIRAYSNIINAEWCGVQWNGLAQGIAVNRALGASIAYGQPVFFDLPFQIEQAIQVQAGASVILGDQCRISGSIVVNWNFVQGSQLVSCAPGAFGPNVRPRFDTGVYEFLRLSWCKGATDDETLTQFLGMPSTDFYTVVVDKSLDDVRTNFTLPGKTSARFEGGRIRFTTGACSISINAWETPPLRQIFEFTSAPMIGSIVLPEPARPEWFGAVGNGSDDDTVPVRAAIRSHRVKLRSLYKVTSWGADSWVEFYGEMIQGIAGINTVAGLVVASGTLIFTNFSAENCAFSTLAGNTIIDCTYVNSYNCSFSGASGSAIDIATSGRFTGCIFDKVADVNAANPNAIGFIMCRFIAEAKTFSKTLEIDTNNQYFSDIPNAEILGTTGTGKVFGVGPSSSDTVDIRGSSLYTKADLHVPEIIENGGTISGESSLVGFDTGTGAASPKTINLPDPNSCVNLLVHLYMKPPISGTNVLNIIGAFASGAANISLTPWQISPGTQYYGSIRLYARPEGWYVV